MSVMTCRNLIITVSLHMMVLACGPRTAETPSLGVGAKQAAASADRSAELDELIRKQSDALEKLSTDKESLEQRADGLDTQIKALNDELARSKTLTEEQKLTMQKEITELQAKRTELQKEIDALNARNAEMKQQLDAAKAENDRLTKALAEAKANQTPAAATTTTAGTTTAAGTVHGFRYVDPNKVKNDCLGMPDASTADNVQLTATPCQTTAQRQKFSVLDPAKQFFVIKPLTSNKCVTVASNAEGAAVVQKTCTNTPDQSWEFFVRGSTEFRLRNAASGKCLKIQTDGKIIQGDCNLNSTYFTWFVSAG